jgi:hypothetical protein
MRRILLVLTVATLMATMVVIAGPAKADTNLGGSNSSNFNNGGTFVSVGGHFGGIGDDDNFDNDGFFFSRDSSFDDIDFGGISFSN